MRISQKGIDFIKSFEGLRLRAYKAAPNEKFYTIGYGHYSAAIKADTVITAQQALQYLQDDLHKFENVVNNLGRDWTQSEFDALVSFAYNCGSANVNKLVKDRDKAQIAQAFLLYNKSGGKVLKGLVRRREAERKMFLQNDELEQIAREVIEGKWGNGRIRKDKLIAAGYDYYKVQSLVNNILTGG